MGVMYKEIYGDKPIKKPTKESNKSSNKVVKVESINLKLHKIIVEVEAA